MLTVKELLYIKLIAQERSFSTAAKRAKISQPALSAAIAKVEDKLGESLFYRDSHTVNPTSAGRYIAERSEHLINEFESLTSEFANFKNRDTGAIPFGVGVTVADTLLKDAVVSFQQENQSVTPKFQVDYWYELRQALLRDDISFFIAANHEFVEDRELSTEDLYVSEICFHARKNHPLTKKKIVRCADLINYPLLTYRTLVAKKRVKDRLTTEEQLRAFQKNFVAGTLNSMQGTLPFVEATDYLAMTERGFYDSQSQASQIQELEVEDFRLKLQIKICWRAKHLLSAREQDLINCFKNAAAARVLP